MCARMVVRRVFLSTLFVVTFFWALPISSGQAQDTQTISLRYKLQPGERIVSRVEHFAETRTTMSEHEESSRSQTSSEKVWEVTSVNQKGEMTFEYRINAVSLAQSVGDAEEQKYDSSEGGEIPDMFKPVAETVGKTLATVTINPQGQVIDRDKELKTPQLGMGELTLPLPSKPISVGDRWSVPRELRVKLESGTYKKIKVRELYTLEKVATGVATIRIVTQPLTPVDDPADVDRGRLISKKLDWSEEVVGFRGAETSLRYDGTFKEELVSQTSRTATRSNSPRK